MLSSLRQSHALMYMKRFSVQRLQPINHRELILDKPNENDGHLVGKGDCHFISYSLPAYLFVNSRNPNPVHQIVYRTFQPKPPPNKAIHTNHDALSIVSTPVKIPGAAISPIAMNQPVISPYRARVRGKAVQFSAE